MKIFNVRLGFANNSSSSHSLIFLDDMPYNNPPGDDYNFGWGNFTLSSEKSKMDYLAVQLLMNLQGYVGSRIAVEVVEEWTGRSFDIDNSGWADAHVDHQSVYTLPCNWRGDGPHREFFEDFKKYLLQGNLVILGGNDNEDNHPLGDGTNFTLPMAMDEGYYGRQSVARWDEKYKYWSIFNRRTGAKIRLSFEAGHPQYKALKQDEDYYERKKLNKPERAFAPELVDIKITDFCNHTTAPCWKFCFQGSHTRGKHASLSDIEKIAKALADLNVFEVAIGGGEPTKHPDFLEILRTFDFYGVVPNFTTRSVEWVENAEIWNLIGSVAFSISSLDEAAEIMKRVSKVDAMNQKARGIYKLPLAFQYVMGTKPEEEFAEILQAVNLRNEYYSPNLTLLGYKHSERGAKFAPYSYENWLQICKDSGVHRIQIDTVLAEQSKEMLETAHVPSVMYHTKDGLFSMYLDAVSSKLGPSSYCEPNELTDFSVNSPVLKDLIKEHFQSF